MKKNCKVTDEELVDRFINGETSAFEILVYRYKDKVYNYIYKIVRDEDVADDIFQEAFIKIIIKLRQNKYFHIGKFASWIIRISHNLVIDYYRKLAVQKTVSCDACDSDILNEVSISSINNDCESINENVLDDIEKLISQLPSEQKRVVYLRFYKNKSFKEIADIESISINTALGRMRYALINMKKYSHDLEYISEFSNMLGK